MVEPLYRSERYYHEVVRGSIPQSQSIGRYGNADLGTTLVPVSSGGIYPMPPPSGATQLRIKAGGNANDSFTGSGAQLVLMEGYNVLGQAISDILPTNGTEASINTVNSYFRLQGVTVIQSGTYATATTGSHAGDICIEDAAGTQDWACIESSPFPFSRAAIGPILTPPNKNTFIEIASISVEGVKVADFYLMARVNALVETPPLPSLFRIYGTSGISGGIELDTRISLGPIAPLTDLIPMGRMSSGTGRMNVGISYVFEEL